MHSFRSIPGRPGQSIRRDLPLGVAPGSPELTAGMHRVTASLWCQGMQKQGAPGGISGRHQLPHEFEIFVGLLFAPGRTPGGKRLQTESRGKGRMTVVTAKAIFPELQKNRLDVRAIIAKLSGSACRGAACCCATSASTTFTSVLCETYNRRVRGSKAM